MMSLVNRIEEAWQNSSIASQPDLSQLLGDSLSASAEPREILNALQLDQRRRWLTTNPLRVEDYLALFPSLPAGVDWVFELAVGEFEARQNSGRPLSAEEINTRFPSLSDTLRQHLISGQQSPPAEIPDTVIRQPQELSVTYITGRGIGVGEKGRYRLDRVLGEGAFGRVYLGYDDELHRQVAIKVPNSDQFQQPGDADQYLTEARTLAGLQHPHIVSVYDVGRTDNGSIYIVSQYVDGGTLKDRISGQPWEPRRAAELLIPIAQALHSAHQRRLIHRDVKPENILLDAANSTPFIADFGLAIREEDYLQDQRFAGTPYYMSPEQARGEGHRIDGRSDVFSLGVVLYELLTGTRPFEGKTISEVVRAVTTQEPRSLCQLVPALPSELERICLKALAKRTTDRFATALLLAEDLEEWLKPKAPVTDVSPSGSRQIVPRGLRSFDATDAGFFLDLLPGTRNRDGLPESIAFWKQRIEETDPEKTFNVGLMLGPSGCGKSSLVKAGLLPHLSRNVIAVYLEATPDETELRVLRGLKKCLVAWTFLSETCSPSAAAAEANTNATGKNAHPTSDSGPASPATLTETLLHLRRGQQQKIVIIIDQFEQWLHAHRAEPDADLVRALRQCDGVNVQAIVMIRDDFAMAAARFMQALDVAILQGHNFATVDLFEVDHAKNVLIKFGQAFGKLPTSSENLSAEESQFVSDVANGLSQDTKVVSVRLSLFAEMIKTKRWTPETLQAVGGTEGIGVNFLEETFSSAQANPRHRLHATAARAMLKSLLPELGTDIKGHMRSQQELSEASGYNSRPADFADLLRILDGELRLITPTDPEGATHLTGEPDASASGSLRSVPSGSHTSAPVENNPPAHAGGSPVNSSPRYYQLTHDYLVPSLREWLTRKQKETRKGRAELKLEERAALWTAKPENRHLPSLREWIGIRWLTDTHKWTGPQKNLMGRAAKVHGLRGLTALFGLCLLFAIGMGLNRQGDERRNQAEATRLVEGLLAANTAQVSNSLTSLKDFRAWADPQLQQAFKDAEHDSDAKLHAGLALVADGRTADPAVMSFLQERLLTVTPVQLQPVRELLTPHQGEFTPAYWKIAKDEQQPAARRFRAACALAGFDATSSEWKSTGLTTTIAEQLVSVSPEYIGEFKELLRPVSSHLVPKLSTIFQDEARGELTQTLATSLLADYAASDPDTLSDLVIAADAASDKTLFPVLQQHDAIAVKNMEAVLARRLEPDWKDAPLDPTWTEPSAAIRAQIESAHGMITDRFAFCQDMPLPQFLELAETLRASGYRPTRVRPNVERLSSIVQNPVVPASDSEPSQAQENQAQEERERLGQSLYNVAAIWTRDGQRWHIDPSLKSSDLPGPDAPASKDGLLLADIAPLPLADETADPKFLALWSEPTNADEERRVLIDLTEKDLSLAQEQLTEQGFVSQSTITVRTNNASQRLYTAIVSNQGAPSEVRPAYAGFELAHQPQWDVATVPESKSIAPPGLRIASIWRAHGEIPFSVFVPVGESRWNEVKPDGAIFEFEEVGNSENRIELLDRSRGFRFRLGPHIAEIATGDGGFSRWTNGKWITIEECMDLPQVKDPDPEFARKAFLRMMPHSEIVIAAWNGEHEKSTTGFEAGILDANPTAESDFSWACAASVAAFAPNAPVDTRRSYEDFALEWLTRALAAKAKLGNAPRTDERLNPLHANARFQQLLSEFEATNPELTFAAIWRADVQFESKLLAAVPMASVAEQLIPLLTEGWRPFAIAVDAQSGANAGGLTPTTRQKAATGGVTEPLCTVVLHRPLIPDAKKESLALQQAAAATALLRLNAAHKVWPLLQDKPDPRVRSYLLHRLARYGIDPLSLITQLAVESDVTRRRSLILGLGEFAKAKLLTTDQQTTLTADLAKRYADDPDSGVHGAAEWTLKQLGADAEITEIRTAFSTGQIIGDRQWYLTKTGKSSHHSPSDATAAHPALEPEEQNTALTFAILDASDEFLMGSPVSEAERFGGPTGQNEIRHRRWIGRRFAIGTHEVTVAQFQAFRKQNDMNRTYSRELDAPANTITWYDAAAYCNWLSEQEGIPRDQWCYDPEQPFQEGMTLLPDYLQRTGYRLPSEAEWEFACRAGTMTARYFGETETLLGEYAWYTKTSGDQWMLPVGTLRPNGTGLFDMQGNVHEWCQDDALFFDTNIERMGDREQMGDLDNSRLRVLRGGSFYDDASVVRSALRTTFQPVHPRYNYGIRVSRTLPPVPLTALPPAEGP